MILLSVMFLTACGIILIPSVFLFYTLYNPMFSALTAAFFMVSVNKSKAVHTIVWYSLPAWSAVENPACSLVGKVTGTDNNNDA